MELIYLFPEPLPLPRARGVQVVNTIAALARQRVSVSLLYVPVEGQYDPFTAYGKKCPEGVELVRVSRRFPSPLSVLPATSNKLFAHRAIRWIKGYLKEHQKPPVIFVRHIKVAAAIIEEFPELSVIYEAHEVFTATAPKKRKKRVEELEWYVATNATVVVCNSAATAGGLSDQFNLGRDLTVVPNGVLRPDSLPDKPWEEAHKHVIYAGSFFPWKGVEDLVDAAAELPGFKVTLVGGDEERIQEYRKKLSTQGAEVDFTGRLSQDKVMELLTESCIAVLPNRLNPDSAWTSPIKLFEYLGAGCAVVATDIPSVREILSEPDSARWCDAGNPKALAAAIKGLAQEPDMAQKMSQKGREMAKQYTWDRRGERLVNVIRELVGE